MTAEEEKVNSDADAKQPTKMNNLMDAASALTSLGDGESEGGSRPSSPSGEAKNSVSEETEPKIEEVTEPKTEEKPVKEEGEEEAVKIEQTEAKKRYLVS